MSFGQSFGALALMLAVLFVITVLFKIPLAKLNLNVAYPKGEDVDPGWKLPLHSVFYTAAGICLTAFVAHIQHWPVAIFAAGALVLGATLAPGVDWSKDSKLKRFAYCAINLAYGAAVGAFLIPIIPDITWI